MTSLASNSSTAGTGSLAKKNSGFERWDSMGLDQAAVIDDYFSETRKTSQSLHSTIETSDQGNRLNNSLKEQIDNIKRLSTGVGEEFKHGFGVLKNASSVIRLKIR